MLLGTGLQVKVIIDLPKLANDIKVLRNLCNKYDINIVNQTVYTFHLESVSSFCLTEFQLVAKFFTGIKEILEFEQ